MLPDSLMRLYTLVRERCYPPNNSSLQLMLSIFSSSSLHTCLASPREHFQCAWYKSLCALPTVKNTVKEVFCLHFNTRYCLFQERNITRRRCWLGLVLTFWLDIRHWRDRHCCRLCAQFLGALWVGVVVSVGGPVCNYPVLQELLCLSWPLVIRATPPHLRFLEVDPTEEFPQRRGLRTSEDSGLPVPSLQCSLPFVLSFLDFDFCLFSLTQYMK